MSLPIRNALPHLLMLAGFIALAMLQVPGALFGELIWDERISEYIPWRVEAARLIANGEFPFFTDKVFGGMPLFATAYVGVLYPLNLFYLLFPPIAASNFLEVLHGVLAGVGMMLYLRGHRLSPMAGFLGGAFYMLLLFHGLHAGHVSMREAAAIAPWVAWAGSRALRRGTLGAAALLAGMILLQWVVGYAQVVLFTLLWLCWEWAVWFRWRRENMVVSVLYAAACAVGCCLAMVQIQPAAALVGMSARQQMTMELWQAGSLPPQFLALLIQPVTVSLLGNQWDGVDYNGEWVVTPLPPVVLLGLVAPLAMLLFPRFRRSPRGRFVAGAAVAAVLTLMLALGKYLPANELLFRVPPFNMFRIPSRWILLFGVAIVVLAAVAIDWIGRMRPRERVLSLAGAAILLVAVSAGAWILAPMPESMQPDARPALASLLLQGETPWIARVATRFQNVGMPGFWGLFDRLEFHLVVLAMVPALLALRRKWLVYTAAPVVMLLWIQWFQVLSIQSHWPMDQSEALVTEKHPLLKGLDLTEITRVYSPSPDGHTPGFYALLQNTHLFHGVRGLQGYCPLLNERIVFSLNIGQGGNGWRDYELYDNPAMAQTMAVSHMIIQESRLSAENHERWQRGREHHFDIVATHMDYHLVRLRESPPRFQLAHEWQPIEHHWQAEPDVWNPQGHHVEQAPVKLEDPPWRYLPPPNERLGGGTVEVLEEATSRVLLRVSSDGPGVLLIRDVFWPGWRWQVVKGDGPRGWQRVRRAQSILRYLPVADGESLIEIVYTPPKFREGFTVSLAALGLWFIMMGMWKCDVRRWISK